MSDRLLLAGLFFRMTSFVGERWCWWGTTTWTGEILTLVERFLAGGARPAGRRERFARPPAAPPLPATTAPAPASATRRVPVALAMVLVAEFFKTSRTALRVLFLPETMFANSGTKEETKFLPNSLATGKTYFFIKGIATRPIRMANAPIPPEPNCRAGPWNVDG